MYYQTLGLTVSQGSSGSRYTSPFGRPAPHRWYMPTAKPSNEAKQKTGVWIDSRIKK